MNWLDRFLEVLIKVTYATFILAAIVLLIIEFIALFMMIGEMI